MLHRVSTRCIVLLNNYERVHNVFNAVVIHLNVVVMFLTCS